jgi:hypothetical protein
MYQIEFTNPMQKTMQLILRNRSYFDAYVDGLMYIHDLICDLPINRDYREFVPTEIHENMTQMMKPDVYLSFSTRDRLELAIALVDQLRANGINVWVWLPGTGLPIENWDIPLAHSTCFVTIISPQARKSRWVKYEWQQANKLKKPIVVVRTEIFDMHSIRRVRTEISDNDSIPRVLRNARVVNVGDLHNGAGSLIKAIRDIIDKPDKNNTHLPFEIAENLRQNYDAARRLWFLGKMGEFHRKAEKEAIEKGVLDVEAMATHFVDGLLRTYTALLMIESEIGSEM